MGQSQRDDVLVAQHVTPSRYKSLRDVINPRVLLISSLFARTPVLINISLLLILSYLNFILRF
jgi:hypothetical protein